MTETMCVCGHAAEPHTHHRDRRDCSRCGRELCREFRPLTWWRRVLNRCGWYPAPLPDPVPAVDFTSLFTPARFQVVERVAAWHAGAERVLSPEQWAAAARDVDAAALWFEQSPDADGHPIEVGDWVETLNSPCQIGEVVETLGDWCEVRIPTSSAIWVVLCERVRVIRWEES